MPLVRDAILVYLRARRQRICARCLGKALHLSPDRMMDAWLDLKRRGDFPLRRGVCAVCMTANTEVIEPQP
jgi:hypothetical protein